MPISQLLGERQSSGDHGVSSKLKTVFLSLSLHLHPLIPSQLERVREKGNKDNGLDVLQVHLEIFLLVKKAHRKGDDLLLVSCFLLRLYTVPIV